MRSCEVTGSSGSAETWCSSRFPSRARTRSPVCRRGSSGATRCTGARRSRKAANKAPLDVEPEQQDVPVLHHVVPPLASDQALLARRLVRPRALEIAIGHRLGADESTLEVGMDLAGGVECNAAAMHGPGTYFVLPDREERLQAKQPVARMDQPVESRLADAGAGQVFRALIS